MQTVTEEGVILMRALVVSFGASVVLFAQLAQAEPPPKADSGAAPTPTPTTTATTPVTAPPPPPAPSAGSVPIAGSSSPSPSLPAPAQGSATAATTPGPSTSSPLAPSPYEARSGTDGAGLGGFDTYHPPKVVAYEGGRIPKDAKLEERPRWGLIGTGIGLAAGAYALSLTYAISTCGAQMECRNGSAWLYAPIVGPFIAASHAPTSGGKALATFDGAVQVSGVVLFIAGFVAPKQVVVTYRDASIRVEPVSVGSGMGLGVTVTNM